MLNTKEVATKLHVSIQSVNLWAQKGILKYDAKLPSVQGGYIFSEENVYNFVTGTKTGKRYLDRWMSKDFTKREELEAKIGAIEYLLAQLKEEIKNM